MQYRKEVKEALAQRNNITRKREPKKTTAPSKSKVIQMPKKTKTKKPGMIDYTFLFVVVLIVCAGMVMLLSASTPAARTKYGNSYYFFSKQLIFVIAGFIGMAITSYVDYKIYKKYAPYIFGIALFLIVIVAIPGIGIKLNGSRRWLPMPGFNFQPSELMKIAIAILFAAWVDDKKYGIETFKGSVRYYAIIGVVSIFMLLEPHLSGTIVIAGIGLSIMAVSGTPLKPIAIAAPVVGAVGFGAIYMFDPGRLGRLMRFLDPFSDLQHTGYQISQALYAIGSGGLFGKGLGRSVQKFSYLPEPYNDFIFAVVCEELGLLGAALIIGLFAALIWKGMKVAFSAPDKFGSLLVVGIMSQVAIQTIFNIAVATSSIPNTGVSLPFFSYGGTAVMILLCEMGIVLNVSRNSVGKTE